MLAFLDQITYWHWWIAGVVLVIVEALLPGVVFLWMGIAAGVTGFILFFWPGIEWQAQVMIFAGLSVISVVAGRMWLRSRPTETEDPNLNRRGLQYVGRVFVLEQEISAGIGKIRVDDTMWRVSGADLAAGRRVRVTGIDGATFLVEEEPEG